eukprot:366570-Chlamydomonas_euryale.AAC.12
MSPPVESFEGLEQARRAVIPQFTVVDTKWNCCFAAAAAAAAAGWLPMLCCVATIPPPCLPSCRQP